MNYFVSQAKAKGYTSANWDEYFKVAIQQNWAKVEIPVGKELMLGIANARP